MPTVNYLAALLASVFSMILGFVWYGKMLFADVWMKESGLTEENLKSGPGIGYLITMIAAFVTGAFTSMFVHMLNITDPMSGAFLGLALGIGFVATTFASNYIFGQKSLKLYVIDAGYQVVNIVAAGIITTLVR